MASISFMKGKGSMNHNMRVFKTDNVDPSRTKDNVIIREPCLEKIYHEQFDQAVAEYNQKQIEKKQHNRQIKNYLSHIRNSKKEKPFHELIVQIGDHAATPEEKIIFRDCLNEYVQDFEQRNPQLKICCAVIHMDEASPHLHLDYVPVAKGNKNGLSVKVANDRAIKQMGNKDWESWREKETGKLIEICKDHQIEYEKMNDHGPHMSIQMYKKQIKAIQDVQKSILTPEKAPSVQNIMFKGQMVPVSDYEALSVQKKALESELEFTKALNDRLMSQIDQMNAKHYVQENKKLETLNKSLEQERDHALTDKKEAEKNLKDIQDCFKESFDPSWHHLLSSKTLLKAEMESLADFSKNYEMYSDFYEKYHDLNIYGLQKRVDDLEKENKNLKKTIKDLVYSCGMIIGKFIGKLTHKFRFSDENLYELDDMKAKSIKETFEAFGYEKNTDNVYLVSAESERTEFEDIEYQQNRQRHRGYDGMER